MLEYVSIRKFMKIYQHLRWPFPSLESSVKIFLLYWAAICFPITHSHFFSSTICAHTEHICLFAMSILPVSFLLSTFAKCFSYNMFPTIFWSLFVNPVISYLAPYAMVSNSYVLLCIYQYRGLKSSVSIPETLLWDISSKTNYYVVVFYYICKQNNKYSFPLLFLKIRIFLMMQFNSVYK